MCRANLSETSRSWAAPLLVSGWTDFFRGASTTLIVLKVNLLKKTLVEIVEIVTVVFISKLTYTESGKVLGFLPGENMITFPSEKQTCLGCGVKFSSVLADLPLINDSFTQWRCQISNIGGTKGRGQRNLGGGFKKKQSSRTLRTFLNHF